MMFSSIVCQCLQVGLAVAYPIMQCGLFVAGVWGLAFGELPRTSHRVEYACCGALLIAAAVALNYATQE